MSKIRILLSFILIFTCTAGLTQKLMVHGSSPNLYLEHKVAPKENWYSVGRLYNVSPREIAPFNKSSIEKALSIGQALKIPLKESNFTQDGSKEADEVFLPVYHVVGEKEWMFRISNSHNKVPVADLEKWNNITNDDLRAGMQMIVGWLKVKKGQSAFASKGSSKIAIATKPTVLADPKKDIVKKDPVIPPVNKTEPQIQQKEESQQTFETKTVSDKSTGNSSSNYKGGYFRTLYREAGNSSTGNAGVFRSTSGWEDGKYYALMNNVPIGTIVKVTFPSTNKSVYAKVLGQLPEMKESNGLSLRISDAAASELGVAINKFYVDVKY